MEKKGVSDGLSAGRLGRFGTSGHGRLRASACLGRVERGLLVRCPAWAPGLFRTVFSRSRSATLPSTSCPSRSTNALSVCPLRPPRTRDPRVTLRIPMFPLPPLLHPVKTENAKIAEKLGKMLLTSIILPLGCRAAWRRADGREDVWREGCGPPGGAYWREMTPRQVPKVAGMPMGRDIAPRSVRVRPTARGSAGRPPTRSSTTQICGARKELRGIQDKGLYGSMCMSGELESKVGCEPTFVDLCVCV